MAVARDISICTDMGFPLLFQIYMRFCFSSNSTALIPKEIASFVVLSSCCWDTGVVSCSPFWVFSFSFAFFLLGFLICYFVCILHLKVLSPMYFWLYVTSFGRFRALALKCSTKLDSLEYQFYVFTHRSSVLSLGLSDGVSGCLDHWQTLFPQ